MCAGCISCLFHAGFRLSLSYTRTHTHTLTLSLSLLLLLFPLTSCLTTHPNGIGVAASLQKLAGPIGEK